MTTNPVPGTVELAEISGSETFIHVHGPGFAWVVQQDGVHKLKIGEPVTAYVNARRLFAFDADGGLVAAPPRPQLGMAAE